MSTVAVTGVCGYLGRHTAAALESDPSVARVVGIDVVDRPFLTPPARLERYLMDVRNPALADAFAGCDTVIHLAFVFRPVRGVQRMRDVNVGGTQEVFSAAVSAGVRRIVWVSTSMVYGAHPDNDMPLTEDSPLREIREFPYAAHAAEVERFITRFSAAHPGIACTVLRCCPVVGPGMDGPSARLLESPMMRFVEGYGPPMQFLHIDDFAAALHAVLSRGLEGTYNLCPEDATEAPVVSEILGRGAGALSYAAARRRMEMLTRLRLSDLPPSFLPYLTHPWVMSGSRLREAGFVPRYSSDDALRAGAAYRRGWISLGAVRFRPARVVAGIGALAVAGSLVRRARSASG